MLIAAQRYETGVWQTPSAEVLMRATQILSRGKLATKREYLSTGGERNIVNHLSVSVADLNLPVRTDSCKIVPSSLRDHQMCQCVMQLLPNGWERGEPEPNFRLQRTLGNASARGQIETCHAIRTAPLPCCFPSMVNSAALESFSSFLTIFSNRYPDGWQRFQTADLLLRTTLQIARFPSL